MSAEGTDSERLADVVMIRVETSESGWALSEQAWSWLGELRWIHLQSDGRGLRGILAGSESSVVSKLAALTRDLEELGVVEVREDVALLRAPASIEHVGVLRDRLSAAGIEAHGLLVTDGRPAAVIDRWRADAAAAL
jgi:hypothetical protein